MAAARAAGLIVIADAKRGDIGTTMDAYAEAWLDPRRAAGSRCDDGQSVPRRWERSRAPSGSPSDAGKGVFVLAATSNADAFPAQRASSTDGRTVSAQIVDEVSARNVQDDPGRFVGERRIRHRRDGGLGGCRAAPTSTRPHRSSARASATREPGPPTSAARFGAAAPFVIASESRSLLSAGPAALAAAIESRVHEYRSLDD